MNDIPIETSIYRGCSIAMFDYQRVYYTVLQFSGFGMLLGFAVSCHVHSEPATSCCLWLVLRLARDR